MVMSVFAIMHESRLTIDQLNFCVQSIARETEGLATIDPAKCQGIAADLARLGYLQRNLAAGADRYQISSSTLAVCGEALAKTAGENRQ